MNSSSDHSVDPTTITKLLERAASGDAAAANDLVAAIYAELRAVATSLMRNERPDHTLQPTALVNEALLRLLSPAQLNAISNRRMLFAAGARAMRQVLIDYAAQRQAQKRGGDWRRTPLDKVIESLASANLNVERMEDALDELEKANPRCRQAIDLRFFHGMKIKEVAAELGVSTSLVEKELLEARRFLREQLQG